MFGARRFPPSLRDARKSTWKRFSSSRESDKHFFLSLFVFISSNRKLFRYPRRIIYAFYTSRSAHFFLMQFLDYHRKLLTVQNRRFLNCQDILRLYRTLRTDLELSFGAVSRALSVTCRRQHSLCRLCNS